jgi:DNA-binding LytR/AlgR family response regulator
MLIGAMEKMKAASKLIASTGQGEEARVPELETLHATHFLTKPYDTERLVKTLHDTRTSSVGGISRRTWSRWRR